MLAKPGDLTSTAHKNPCSRLHEASPTQAPHGCALNASVQPLEECTVTTAVFQLVDNKRRSCWKWLLLKRRTVFIPWNKGQIAATTRWNNFILLFYFQQWTTFVWLELQRPLQLLHLPHSQLVQVSRDEDYWLSFSDVFPTSKH